MKKISTAHLNCFTHVRYFDQSLIAGQLYGQLGLDIVKVETSGPPQIITIIVFYPENDFTFSLPLIPILLEHFSVCYFEQVSLQQTIRSGQWLFRLEALSLPQFYGTQSDQSNNSFFSYPSILVERHFNWNVRNHKFLFSELFQRFGNNFFPCILFTTGLTVKANHKDFENDLW